MTTTSPTTTRYRVVRTTKVGYDEERFPVEQDFIWEGSDLTQLSRTYPPSQIFGADPLGRSEIEGGYVVTTHRFEQFVDGDWQVISDPRTRVTPVTMMERAIDEENRRLFPGDYI